MRVHTVAIVSLSGALLTALGSAWALLWSMGLSLARLRLVMATRINLHVKLMTCGKQLFLSCKHDICCDNKCDSLNVPLNIVKINVPFAELKCKMLHHCVINTCIIASDPTDLNNIKECELAWSFMHSKIILHTFLVIFRQSVTHNNASARCQPPCQPETCWNPIRSAQSFSVNLGLYGVLMPVPWIQWAVTTINGLRFGSDHRSSVSEILPRQSCCLGSTPWSVADEWIIYLHAFPSPDYQNALLELPPPDYGYWFCVEYQNL